MFTSSSRGISLLAVMIMIGVLGISLTVTRLFLYQQTEAHRESEARKEMKEIYEAIMGNPEMGVFGYVGNMGTPPDSLNDLIVNQDTLATKGFNGVKIGWDGPYINVGRDLESYRKDAWGNDYTIVGVYQIRSNGPDGTAGTSDDIMFPSKPINSVNGSLVLKVPKGGVLCNQFDISDVVVYYSEEGIEKTKFLETDFNLSDDEDGFYTTDPIPLHHGIHAVEVRHSISDEASIHQQMVRANIAVFADSTLSQIVGTLPHTGIHLHPLFLPQAIAEDNTGEKRIIEVNVVNATGCEEGEGVSYDVSRIDIAEIGGVEDHFLLEISFNGNVVFAEDTGIPISHDIENPTSITLSEMYRLQPGKSLNELKFLNAVALNTSFVLTYHYTDTEEPKILGDSTVSFRLEGL